MTSSDRKPTLAKWSQSLYSRAFLFTSIGCGFLLGAVLVQSGLMVNGTVERLLQERMSLARTTGSYVEQLMHRELDQIGDAVASAMRTGAASPDQLRQILDPLYSATMYREGAFVLGRDGQPLASVPEADPAVLLKDLPLAKLLAEARRSDLPVISPLHYISQPPHPVMVALAPLKTPEGSLLGFIGGLLHPASNNLLEPFEQKGIGTESTMQLIDSSGTVVASTKPGSLFKQVDHGSLLSGAIQQKKEIRGRCHRCHEEEGRAGARMARESEVLAFAPLPNFSLGLAVQQSEKEALAPAFYLRARLIMLGIAFIVLFLFFTALSVYSVVDPLKRLTRAVREIESGSLRDALPSFGPDEVGMLARALDRWRGRVVDSLQALQLQEEALQREVTLTQRHLATLQEVSELGTGENTLQGVMDAGLGKLLSYFDLRQGILRIRYGSKEFLTHNGLTEVQIAAFNSELERLHQAGAAETNYTQVLFELPDLPAFAGLKVLIAAGVTVSQGLQISCLIADTHSSGSGIEDRRLRSILHQIVMSAANRLLHEQDQLRHRQSREFLQRVLDAQEEERRRIARELHDTIAQDLAAHRLSVERLLRSKEEGFAPETQVKLEALEKKAHDMLTTLRQLLLDLRPSVLDNMGFLPALQWYLERMQRDHGIRGTLSVEQENLQLSRSAQLSLFRIFQEALQNMIVHARAEHFFVTVGATGDAVEMTMEDDGVGFDPEALSARPVSVDGHGLGVLGMKERANLLKGSLTIQSKPEEGTVIKVSIPLSSDVQGGIHE